MYLMDDQTSLILKADLTISSTEDICATNFMDPSNTLGQYVVDLKAKILSSLSFTVTSIPGIFVFLNNNLYTVVYGGSSQSMIVQVKLSIAAGVLTSSVVNVYTTTGVID